jgi:hypothetical protein
MSDMEVDQKTDRQSAELQVCEKLRLMNRQELLDRLDLHDDDILWFTVISPSLRGGAQRLPP